MQMEGGVRRSDKRHGGSGCGRAHLPRPRVITRRLGLLLVPAGLPRLVGLGTEGAHTRRRLTRSSER